MLTPLKFRSVTHLCCMITGDRFYFSNDPQKQVWEVRVHTLLTYHGKTTKLTICKNSQSQTQRFNSNRVAIYLRSTNPRRQPDYKKPKTNYMDNFFIH